MSMKEDNLDEISDEDLFKALEEALVESEEKNNSINYNKIKKTYKENKKNNEIENIDKKEEKKDANLKEEKEINNISKEIENNKEIKKDSLEILKNSKSEEICDMIQKKIPNIDIKDLELIKNTIENENKVKKNNSYDISKILYKIKKNIVRIIIFMVIFIITIILFRFFIIKYKNRVNLPKNSAFASKNIIRIKQPISLSNNKYIYVSESKIIGNRIFNLLKILIDGDKTIFYFDRNINWNKYNVVLQDNKNKIYNNIIDINKNKNYIEFSNLEEGIKAISLTIEEKEGENKENFIFIIKEGVVLPKVLYLNEEIDIIDNNKISFKINKSIFSSSSSTLYYVIENKEKNDFIDIDRVNLIQNNMSLPIKNNENYKIDENITLGKLTFAPLYNFNENIKLRFCNLSIIDNVNKEIEISKLFKNTLEDQVKIEINKKVVILERLGLINNKYILVFYTLDENNNRIKAELNADIKTVDKSGKEVILEGISKSNDEGTDMIFDIKKEDVDIKNKSLTLNIKDLKYKQKDIIKEIDISDIKKEDEDESEVKELIESIVCRLEDKDFENINNIVYNFEENRFFGVFLSQKQDIIYKHIIKATKNNERWNFSETITYDENKIK